MQRRALLKTAGASLVAGAAITGTTAASDDDPQTVSFEYISAEDAGVGPDEYRVESAGDHIVVITGSVEVPSVNCHRPEVAGVESTADEDVVQLKLVSPNTVCLPAFSTVGFRIELEHVDDPRDVGLEVVNTDEAPGNYSKTLTRVDE
ncbi:hypothetical protein [Haloterrigena salinisoli]|uniref:hypothetical protein n=1 Tax=Haloterrigena salinisoli TaxID=3132747 RepID=UPI0030CAECF9